MQMTAEHSFKSTLATCILWRCLLGIFIVQAAVFGTAAVCAAGQIKVYWGVIQDIVIHRANLDGTEAEDIVQSSGGATPDIAFDPVEQKMYWPSPVAGGLERANYDGSHPETVIDGLEIPTHVAIDAINRKAYWADLGGENSIWRSSLDGTNRELLVEGVPRITALEVDPLNGYYYWSELLDGTIHRTSLEDNSQTQVIFDQHTFGRAGLPWGLTIDPVNGYLYATDTVFQAIARMRLDGSEPTLWVTSGVSDPHGIVVDMVNERVIWSNEAKSPVMREDTNISSVNFLGGDQRIDFVPHARFGMDGYVRHLAILELPIPEPSTLVMGLTGTALFLFLSTPRRAKRGSR
jgi:hypothetical protein